MTARVTALLSLLLTISAAFGVPVITGVALRVSAAIVCEQREQRTEQLKRARSVPPSPAFVTPSPIDPAASVLLAHALFQRPPPAA